MTHSFHSARWQALEERTGSAVTTYVWGGESGAYVDRLVLRDRPGVGGGGGGDGERLHVQQDANYNVTSLTDTSGTVVERYAYDPYGRRAVLAANWSPLLDNRSQFAFTHGHQGGRHELGMNAELVHFRHRDLHVSLGRWMTQDPAGYVDGGSLYEYVGSSPRVNLDPRGLFWGKWRLPFTGGYILNSSSHNVLIWSSDWQFAVLRPGESTVWWEDWDYALTPQGGWIKVRDGGMLQMTDAPHGYNHLLGKWLISPVQQGEWHPDPPEGPHPAYWR